MFFIYRLIYAIAGIIFGFALWVGASFLASQIYQFDIGTYLVNIKPFIWGFAEQYWFVVLLVLVIAAIIPTVSIIQFASFLLITITILLGKDAYAPQYEKELIREIEILPASALSYECNNKCQTDVISLKNGTTLNLESQSLLVRLFIGNKVNVIMDKNRFTTSNSTIFHLFRQEQKTLNEQLLRQKLKEMQDAKTDTAIKFQ